MSAHPVNRLADTTEREQFLETYADNLSLLLDSMDAIASELAQAGDYQAASFFSGTSKAIAAFATAHFPIIGL